MHFLQTLPRFMSLIKSGQPAIARPFGTRLPRVSLLRFRSMRRGRRFGLMANFGPRERCTRHSRTIGTTLGTADGFTTNAVFVITPSPAPWMKEKGGRPEIAKGVVA